MLDRLRLRLMALYLLTALALIGLLGGSVYLLIDRYFRRTTDMALLQRMTYEFQQLRAPLPANLALIAGRNIGQAPQQGGALASEVAGIVVLPLDAGGRLLFNPNVTTPPIDPDPQAVSASLSSGSDWRTVRAPDGARVRLLTMPLTRSDGPAVLQLGRTLTDQDQALNQLLLALLSLGGACAVIGGWVSWWLAGRSLVPAQEAWDRQQLFVANASHELRAPLTLLRASAEVAYRSLPAADEDRRGLLADVLAECDTMGRLVDDLLLLSRLDAGQLKLELQAVPLAELLDSLRRQAGRLAQERRVTLEIADSRDQVQADQSRLRQILLILLDNALRHTPAGGCVRLVTQVEGAMVRLSVVDNGSGIAQEHLPHIMERFYRASSSRGEQQPGSGLGLAIAKSLVEAQHGRITIASQVGRGTEVTVLLPLAATESEQRRSRSWR